MEAEIKAIQQLAPFAGTTDTAEEQYNNIITALFDNQGQPFQGVTDIVQEYGRPQATKATIRTTIKEEPDEVIERLYRVLKNIRGNQLIINYQQFSETIKTALGIMPSPSSGSSGGSNDDTDTGEDTGDDTGEDDSGSDNGSSQPAQNTSGNGKLMTAAIVLTAIAAVYYLTRN